MCFIARSISLYYSQFLNIYKSEAGLLDKQVRPPVFLVSLRKRFRVAPDYDVITDSIAFSSLISVVLPC